MMEDANNIRDAKGNAMTARPLPAYARVPAARRRRLVDIVLQLDARYRQRRALAQLGPAQLKDLGLTSADVREEVSPAWDAPHWWR
jgi:uncharacterized protein YjiS (DUF1127 family)